MSLVGLSGSHRMRVAASATRGYAGEPLINTSTSLSSGVASVNTVVVATDGTGVIGTDQVAGLALTDMIVNSAGTVVASKLTVGVPIPFVTKWRGNAIALAADTDSELLGLLWDVTVFDLTSTTYGWQHSLADTGAFIVRDGNPTRNTLDCVIDARGMRVDIS